MADTDKDDIRLSTYDIKTKTGDNGCDETIVIHLNDIDYDIELNNPGGVNDFEQGNIDEFKGVSGPLIKIDPKNEDVLDPANHHLNTLRIVGGPNSGDFWDVEWIYIYSHAENRSYLFTHPSGELHPTQKTIKACPYPLFVIASREGR